MIINQIDWEGATESASNPLQATISKTTASKNVIKIKYGTKVLRELRLWVVWATTVSDSNLPIEESTTPDFGIPPGPGRAIRGGYTSAHTIEPVSIITDSNRPNFSGVNTVGSTADGHNQW